MACAHSRSSAASSSQPPLGSCAGLTPFAKTTVRLGAFKPNCVEKVCKSFNAVGAWKATTTAIAPNPPVGFAVTTFGLQEEEVLGTREYTHARDAGVSNP